MTIVVKNLPGKGRRHGLTSGSRICPEEEMANPPTLASELKTEGEPGTLQSMGVTKNWAI